MHHLVQSILVILIFLGLYLGTTPGDEAVGVMLVALSTVAFAAFEVAYRLAVLGLENVDHDT